MGKKILVILFFTSLVFSKNNSFLGDGNIEVKRSKNTNSEVKDDWIAIDKLQHFSYSLLISLGCQYVLVNKMNNTCLLYTSPSPRDRQKSRMPSSA